MKYRTREKLKKISNRPILMVKKSNKHLYAQLIDVDKGEILVSASDYDLKKDQDNIARAIGELIGERAKKKKITEIVFDRSPHPYKGKVKDIAEGARSAGLKF